MNTFGMFIIIILLLLLFTCRYYPCDILADWGPLACTVKERASVCLKNTTQKDVTNYATISTQDTITFRVINTEPYITEVSYTTETETTTIELKCTSGIETQGDTFIQLASSTIHNLKFSLVSKHACPIQLTLHYGNPPVLFILLIVVGGVILLVYFLCGVFYQFFVKGATGIELVPHIEFWKETPYLFRDGFLFVFSCYRPFL